MPLILLLFAIGVWYFVGAIWAFVCVLPLIVIFPIAVIHKCIRWWTTRHRRRAADDRQRAFRERIDIAIRKHEEMFPEASDVDENGIPYLILPLVILPWESILKATF